MISPLSPPGPRLLRRREGRNNPQSRPTGPAERPQCLELTERGLNLVHGRYREAPSDGASRPPALSGLAVLSIWCRG